MVLLSNTCHTATLGNADGLSVPGPLVPVPNEAHNHKPLPDELWKKAIGFADSLGKLKLARSSQSMYGAVVQSVTERPRQEGLTNAQAIGVLKQEVLASAKERYARECPNMTDEEAIFCLTIQAQYPTLSREQISSSLERGLQRRINETEVNLAQYIERIQECNTQYPNLSGEEILSILKNATVQEIAPIQYIQAMEQLKLNRGLY